MCVVKLYNSDTVMDVIAWLEELITDVASLDVLVSALEAFRDERGRGDQVDDGMPLEQRPGVPHHDAEPLLKRIVGYEQLRWILAEGLSALCDRPDILLELLLNPSLLRELQELVFVEGGPYWDRPRSHDKFPRTRDYFNENDDDSVTADPGAFLEISKNTAAADEKGDDGCVLVDVIVWLESLITDVAALDKLTSVLGALWEGRGEGSSSDYKNSDTMQKDDRYPYGNSLQGCDAWLSQCNGIHPDSEPRERALTTVSTPKLCNRSSQSACPCCAVDLPRC